MSRFSWWMLHEAKWYIFSFLTDFFFLLSCIDCRLWYYFCMFKFVTQNYVIFNVFFFKYFFFCFLSRYCLSVIDLLCMQHILLSRNCRSGWHLHDLHLSFANFLFYFLKICFDKEMLNAKNIFFFQNFIICVRKVPKNPPKQIHEYTQSMILYVYEKILIFFFL